MYKIIELKNKIRKHSKIVLNHVKANLLSFGKDEITKCEKSWEKSRLYLNRKESLSHILNESKQENLLKKIEKKRLEKTQKDFDAKLFLDGKKKIRQGIIKSTAIVSLISFIYFYPSLMQYLQLKNVDKRTELSFPTEIILPNETVVKDYERLIVEYPVKSEELAIASNKLTDKLIKDIKIFNPSIDHISNIIGIYEHPLVHSQHGKDSLISILLEIDENLYSLQYENKSGSSSLNSSNYTKALSSFISILQRSALFDFNETCIKTPESFILGPIPFISQSGHSTERFAIYDLKLTNQNVSIYSASDNDLENNDLDPINAFLGFMNKENELFVSIDYQAENPIDFNPILEAFQASKEIPKEK